ncbi:ribonuclease H [Sesbania bispinosa]|nr:ribonuclease H [Sesbania bispinosa]
MKVKIFLWSGRTDRKGWHSISWNRIIMPKKLGGLGVRSMRLINTSLLGKLVWKFLSNEDKLWIEVLKAKYLKYDSILSVSAKARDSYIWRGILRARDSLKDGFEYQLGLGDSSLWYTDWTGCGKIHDVVPYVNILDTQLAIYDVFINGRWDLNDVCTDIPNLFLNAINLYDPHFHTMDKDCWIWNATSSGTYSVASGYLWFLERHLTLGDINDNLCWI